MIKLTINDLHTLGACPSGIKEVMDASGVTICDEQIPTTVELLQKITIGSLMWLLQEVPYLPICTKFINGELRALATANDKLVLSKLKDYLPKVAPEGDYIDTEWRYDATKELLRSFESKELLMVLDPTRCDCVECLAGRLFDAHLTKEQATRLFKILKAVN
jgi:hypothetical protein